MDFGQIRYENFVTVAKGLLRKLTCGYHHGEILEFMVCSGVTYVLDARKLISLLS